MATFGVLISRADARRARRVLPVERELYIAAAGSPGFPALLPHPARPPACVGAIIVQASLLAALADRPEGLLPRSARQGPAPSWGGMVADGFNGHPGYLVDLAAGNPDRADRARLGLLGDAVRDTLTEAWSPPVRRRRPVAAAPAPESAPVDAGGIRFDPRPEGGVPVAGGRRGSSMMSASIRGRARRSGLSGVGLWQERDRDVDPRTRCRAPARSRPARSLRWAGPRRLLRPRAHRGPRQVRSRSSHRSRWSAFDPDLSRSGGNSPKRHPPSPTRLSSGGARPGGRELLAQVHLPTLRAVARAIRTSSPAGWRSGSHRSRPRRRPTLLIADEPTTALDVTVQAEILV